MKVKLTPTYIGTALMVIIVSVFTFYRIGEWLGWWGVVSVYDHVHTFILNWVIVITFAILGGILFGMFVGYKLSSQGFTPFERSMLTMYARVEDIQERIKRIEGELGIHDNEEEPIVGNSSIRRSLRTPESIDTQETANSIGTTDTPFLSDTPEES